MSGTLLPTGNVRVFKKKIGNRGERSGDRVYLARDGGVQSARLQRKHRVRWKDNNEDVQILHHKTGKAVKGIRPKRLPFTDPFIYE